METENELICLDEATIRDRFTHYGRVAGLLPVWCKPHANGDVDLCVRAWCPEWALDLVMGFVYVLLDIADYFCPGNDAGIPLTIDGTVADALGDVK